MSVLFFTFILLNQGAMKRVLLLLSALFFFLIACSVSQDKKSFNNKPKLESDTIRISNEEIEYDVIIIAKPMGTVGIILKKTFRIIVFM